MKVDMSAKAVTTRLKRVSQLRRLCLSLGKAKPVRNPSPEKTDNSNTTKFNESNNQ
jgi:hypothetical protein